MKGKKGSQWMAGQAKLNITTLAEERKDKRDKSTTASGVRRREMWWEREKGESLIIVIEKL